MRLILVVWAATWGGPAKWLVLVVGVVLLVTAVGYCLLYGTCRFSTAPKPAEK